jgi:hypothetical protein
MLLKTRTTKRPIAAQKVQELQLLQQDNTAVHQAARCITDSCSGIKIVQTDWLVVGQHDGGGWCSIYGH